MADPIAVRSVRKTYGSVVALDDIDLDVGAGEFVSLLGASGSGKTTLLMIIAGFVRPDHGSIKFADREIIAMPPHQRDIGLVFQNYALFPHMTVAENVAFSLRYRGISGADAGKQVAAVLDLVQLGGFGGRRIDQLSGGQRQRVALARAVVFKPRILLMDEPLSALDKKLREQMQIELRQLQRSLGTTTIYVTHDQREALTMSDRVAVMKDGAIEQIGPPIEVYERPNSRFVAGFVGDSQFVKVDLAGDSAARLGQDRISFTRAPDKPGAADTFLVLRPEKLELLRSRPVTSDLNLIGGKVEDIIYQGDNVLVSIRLPTGEAITVRRGTRESSRRAMPAAGEAVWVGIHPEDTVIVAGEG